MLLLPTYHNLFIESSFRALRTKPSASYRVQAALELGTYILWVWEGLDIPGKNKKKKLQLLFISLYFRMLEVLCPTEPFQGKKFTVGCISTRNSLVFTGIEEGFWVGATLILAGSKNTAESELRGTKRSFSLRLLILTPHTHPEKLIFHLNKWFSLIRSRIQKKRFLNE